MRPRTSKYERELKSEERRALIWLGLLAVIVAFYFWLRDSDPQAAPYINFFCNSPCPHITLYWIPFLEALIYYWIVYAVLIPAPIQLPYWLLVYEFFAILALWAIERVTGRRRLLGESLGFAFDGVKVFWRKIRGLRRKFRLRPRATDKL